jgi:hypothetical protein
MGVGRVTGNVGKKIPSGVKTATFNAQGYAYPAEVSEGLVQQLLGSYGSRSSVSVPVKKYQGYVHGEAARDVSKEAKEYAIVAAQIVNNLSGMNYSSDVIALYPGGKDGLINEISDVFYQYLSGNTADGESRLAQVQSGFQSAVEVLTKKKQTDFQNQIDYLQQMYNVTAKELPYGFQWYLETAEANTTAKFPLASTPKWKWNEEYNKELERLKWIDAETERSLNEYKSQLNSLESYSQTIGSSLSGIVTKLFGDVSAQISKIAEERSAAANAKYCSEQLAAFNDYNRLSKEFNDAVDAAISDFKLTNADFWSKVGI